MNLARLATLVALVSASMGCSGDDSSNSSKGTGGASGSGPAAGSGGMASSGSSGSGGGGGSGQTSQGGAGGNGGSTQGGMDASMGGSGGAMLPNDAGSDSTDAPALNLPKRVLLYHFSTLDIGSVPRQITFYKNQLTQWGYDSDDSVDPGVFTDDGLSKYAAVAMINTCFYPFGAQNMTGLPQATALQKFLQKGGGLFGTHCASVTFQSAQTPVLYNQLLGGRAASDHFNGMMACSTLITDHPASSQLAAMFNYSGDTDNQDYVAPDTKVLVKCTWSGGSKRDTPISWYRTEGLGRVFFTSFAKEDTDLSDANIGAKHVVPALGWVLRRQ